ncbi:NUDIX domain-containing protein [Actinomyces vulturis]|uniref:NUDIX domain-containing protein n=1 Tax=Actinomyces vulturis TaxID=1857645 RepID=UPI00082F5EB0|nr:NUDIX hydrolase [Actinomyces vulturis]
MSVPLRDERVMDAELVEHERVWDGPVFGMNDDALILPSGERVIRRQYLAHHSAVAVVALRDGQVDAKEPEVLLIRQYRHPVRARLWEIPAGLLDHPGEDPLLAAQRELAEETQMSAATWHVLMDVFSSPGCSSEALRIFLARDLEACSLPEGFVMEDEEATLEPTWVPLSQAVDAACAGDIHSGTAVTGLLAAQRAWGRYCIGVRKRFLSEGGSRDVVAYSVASGERWPGLRSTDSEWLGSPCGFRYCNDGNLVRNNS